MLLLLLSTPRPGQADGNAAGSAHSAPSDRQILVLNSYQYGLPVPDSINRGILASLTAGGVGIRDIFVEHIDLARIPSSEQWARQADFLRGKLAGKRVDTIIAEGPLAVKFLGNEGKTLFPNANLITMIAPDDSHLSVTHRRIFESPWRVDPGGTLRAALELFPRTRRVFVITGSNDAILPFLETARKAFAPWKGTLDFEYANEMTYEEMLRRVAALPRDTVVIYSSYFSDKTGRAFAPVDVAANVCRVAASPVFAMQDNFLGKGIVGGSLLRTDEMGKQAGKVAVEFLTGRLEPDRPLSSFAPATQMMFDWRELVRWHLESAPLPKGSVIVNRPLTLWGQYRFAVVIAGILILVMTSLSIALAAFNRSLKRAKDNLLALKEELQAQNEELAVAEESLREQNDELLATEERLRIQIREYEESQETLHESNERYQMLFKSNSLLTQRLQLATSAAQLGVWDWNVQENTMDWDDRMFELYGTTRESLPSGAQAWTDLLHPEDRARVGGLYQAALDGGGKFDATFRVLHPDGAVKYLKANGVVVRGTDGAAERVIGISADITEQKLAEESMQSLLDWTPIATFVHRNERILYVNPVAKRIFGATGMRDLGDKKFLDLIHPDSHKVALARKAVTDQGLPIPVTVQKFVKLDGTVFQAEIQSTMFDYNGEKAYISCIIDIDDRLKAAEAKQNLEVQLQQAQKMESVGSLAGGVAHDFNNKLSVIIGHAYLALDRPIPDEVRDSLVQIRKAAEQSADLTRKLLAFARKQTIAPRVMGLNDTVSGMLSMLSRLIGEDIRIAWLPAAQLWPVKFDPSQIDQILVNLCVNARDAITDSGNIVIETENSSIDEEYCARHAEVTPGDYVRLVVSDNGCGMDKATLDRIFEPFFTTKEIGRGTGLGLATVFGIVKQNNGFIDVSSEPGAGATFGIHIPRYLGESDQAPREEAPASAPRGLETILLVEDELPILEMAAKLLTKQGYTVLSANSPIEAIRLAKEHAGEISLVITDVIMPKMNGKDLARRLRAMRPRLKCLYMSGYTDDAIAHHGVLDEGVNFITKPFSLPDFAGKVREVLNG